MGKEYDGTREAGDEEAFIEETRSIAGEVGEEARRRGIWLRPAFDGLRVVCEEGREPREEGPEVAVWGAGTNGTKTGFEAEVGRSAGGLITPPLRDEVEGRGCCCP